MTEIIEPGLKPQVQSNEAVPLKGQQQVTKPRPISREQALEAVIWLQTAVSVSTPPNAVWWSKAAIALRYMVENLPSCE